MTNSASVNVKVFMILLVLNYVLNKVLPTFTPGDKCWPKCKFLFQHAPTK